MYSVRWAACSAALEPTADARHVLRAPAQMFLIRCRVRSAWRSQPLPEPVELPTHFGNVITCLALADGGRVVSASDDYTLKVWSRYSRRCLKTLTGHEGGVWCCDVEVRRRRGPLPPLKDLFARPTLVLAKPVRPGDLTHPTSRATSW